MSQAIREFIRETVRLSENDNTESLPSLNPFSSLISPLKSAALSAKKFVMSVFSKGFTDAQKKGTGKGSIVGSKVSIEKDAPPSFIVLCKVSYQGKDYMVAKKYSGAGDSFNPVPEYGSYLDPNVLINGKIVSLPDPQTVYKFERDDYIVTPVGGRGGDPIKSDFPGIARGPLQRSTVDLIKYTIDPKTAAQVKSEAERARYVKMFDTAVKAKTWVENVILPVNDSKSIAELTQPVREAQWKIFPASYADFDTGKDSGPKWVSTMSPADLFNGKLGLFEFSTDAEVYPPPFSYTVEGIIDRMDGECPNDAKEYVTNFWRNIKGELSEREELNLSICSNEIAGDLMLNLLTVAFAVAGGPAAPVLVAGSIAAQGLALLQILTYQLSKKDKESAAITAARIVLLFAPFIKMRLAYDIIANIIQFVVDIVGGGSLDARWIKALFNRMGLSDDDELSQLPEAVQLGDINSMLASIPLAL